MCILLCSIIYMWIDTHAYTLYMIYTWICMFFLFTHYTHMKIHVYIYIYTYIKYTYVVVQLFGHLPIWIRCIQDGPDDLPIGDDRSCATVRPVWGDTLGSIFGLCANFMMEALKSIIFIFIPVYWFRSIGFTDFILKHISYIDSLNQHRYSGIHWW